MSQSLIETESNLMKHEQIIVEAIVNAPLRRVWDYWTKPEHIIKWNFASNDWCCPHAENDMTVGGLYKARMEAKDGNYGFDFEAVYDEVTPGKSFSYTMMDGRKSTTIFKAVGESTEVTTAFDPEADNSTNTQRDGWQKILNNFKEYAENSEL